MGESRINESVSKNPFTRVLVANRGEIALRAIKACRHLGLETVAVHSTEDAGAAHVLFADRAVCIGPAQARKSYLDVPSLMHVAKNTGCDAVYPGYGFLSENDGFARTCEENGLKFVGPSADVIRDMGDKSRAREMATKYGVPVVPGSRSAFTNVEEARTEAGEVGYPMLLKARAGGGGRGMRVVDDPQEFDKAFSQATREAEGAFGDGAVYLERFFRKVRHIEVQVLGDGLGEALAFEERDCSVQRRHQKLVEESPSPVIGTAVRKHLLEAAVKLTRGLRYEGAGTVEFIYDVESESFYFIEMNTRIQVEHPVTEMRAGIDLVEAQFKIAAGTPLNELKPGSGPRGHAIEFRINAEDWRRDFRPSPGHIESWRIPRGEGIRVDTGVYPGQRVSPHYDSMIAKLIIHGENRADAIDKARRALARFRCEGVVTTVDFHLMLVDHPAFVDNQIHTRWIETEFLETRQETHEQ